MNKILLFRISRLSVSCLRYSLPLLTFISSVGVMTHSGGKSQCQSTQYSNQERKLFHWKTSQQNVMAQKYFHQFTCELLMTTFSSLNLQSLLKGWKDYLSRLEYLSRRNMLNLSCYIGVLVRSKEICRLLQHH